MSITRLSRPDIGVAEVRRSLARRSTPYYSLIAYGRHIGLHRSEAGDAWVARLRTKAGAYYRRRIGEVVLSPSGEVTSSMSYEAALAAAKRWFALPGVHAFAADQKPIGVRRELVVCPVPGIYSVTHAMQDYVDWKRLAAAKSHFETNLSLINHHIIPRLAHMPLAEFTNVHLRDFIKAVLETAPKRGNQAQGKKVPLERLDDESLRKRKKTVNTLIGILRVSFQLAWEGGKVDSDRAWRCLRRLPVVDRPRMLHLTRPECRSLLQECRPDVGRLVLGALYTGCRATELLSMRCGDIGRDGYGVYVRPAKTYRARFVFLPDEAMAWFLDLVKGCRPHDLIFIRDSGKPWYGNYKHLFKTAVRAAALPDEFTFHGLRHTYASQLIQAGATIYAVADQLGHADPTTVLRTYGHLSPQIRESEVRQRFTMLSEENAKVADERRIELQNWRKSLHGGDWREYARISDVRDPETELG